MRDITERLRDVQEAIIRIMKYTQDGRYRYDHDDLHDLKNSIDAIWERVADSGSPPG